MSTPTGTLRVVSTASFICSACSRSTLREVTSSAMELARSLAAASRSARLLSCSPFC
jgi:hypothetical protein